MYGRFHAYESDLFKNQLVKYSAHTRNELAMIKNFINEGDYVIDVGAHIGTIAIPLAVFAGPKGRVLAIEGFADNYNLLAENIMLNEMNDRIQPLHAVVTNNSQKLFEYIRDTHSNSGMGYFKASSEVVPIPTYANSRDIPAVTLDNFGLKFLEKKGLSFLKIDVEGAEFDVLNGAKKLVSLYRPCIYMEIFVDALARFGHTCENIENLLKPLGYRFFVNKGERNSYNDSYDIHEIKYLREGGEFFDFLAVADSVRLRKITGMVK